VTRPLYVALGWLSMGCAVIGALLPLVPMTVFLILAAYFFGRGSPAARHWLVTHPWFGPPIRRWEETGGISRANKALAVVAMAASFGLALALGAGAVILAVQAAALLSAATFVLTRPG